MALSPFQRWVVAVLLPLMAAGCTRNNSPPNSLAAGGESGKTQHSLRVVTTFLPMYLFTQAIAGDRAKVNILIKPGTEVHEYQSTPADVQAIAQADVVVKNGLGLEAFLDNVVSGAENKNLKVIDASQGIAPLTEASPTGAAGTDSSKGSSAHSHTGSNPHVWLDPVLAKRQVENIRDGLIVADPANKAVYQTNASAYLQQLSDLNTTFNQRLKPYKDRTFITFHDAFPYLAKRYQLKQLAVVSIPEDQLAPSDVQNTINTVKQFKVKTLFSEPGLDNKLLTALSKDLNVNVYPLDSLEGGETTPQYYFTVMKKNLATLETAFK
jgi:zinc/manganese transport system substrate-binding protein